MVRTPGARETTPARARSLRLARRAVAPRAAWTFRSSLALGTITSGKSTTSCDGGTPQTVDATAGGQDTVGLGTTSDLIFDPGSSCEILADVDDRTASLNQDTLPCSYSDATTDYYAIFDSFDFTVSGNGQTAKANISTSVLATDANDNLHSCEVTQALNYER